MNIGYACQIVGTAAPKMRSCRLKNAATDTLMEITRHNLQALEEMIRYNIANEIYLFRISSDVVPFGSHPDIEFPWWQLFQSELEDIGKMAIQHGIRLSMHPGQYTVLNSKDPQVVYRAVLDLQYHTAFLDSLGLDSTHKIILHIGGLYGQKEMAVARFMSNYRNLPDNVKQRLVIENDDVLFAIQDVYEIGASLGIPVVFDNLHHSIHSLDHKKSEKEWIEICSHTWQKKDGRQKIHYAQQATGKKTGSHSDTVVASEFINFCDRLDKYNVDIMLEVKDKNLSALKCIHCLRPSRKISCLERAWAGYKYTVLEHSPEIYRDIRQLLKDKNTYPALQFYSLIEKAFTIEPTTGTAINALEHVWGYFKGKATQKQKMRFCGYLSKYKEGKIQINPVKRYLYQLALEYKEQYLLNSHYFYLK